MSKNIIVKTKIETNFGTFEFKGPQEFVDKRIDQVMDKLKSYQEHTPIINPRQKKSKRSKKLKGGKAKFYKTNQPIIIPDLISDSEKIQNLKKFFHSKKPLNQQEVFVVIAYWLKENLNLKEISIDEIWTVYKILGKKPPKVLIQVFRDGKSKKGWFGVGSETGKYMITSIGDTYVDHDLPHPEDNQNL